MMNPLPDEVVFNHILPRLPTRSLLRFRCVCKSWDSFIRHPSFLLLRRSLSPTLGHLLFVCPASAVSTSEHHIFSAPLLPGQPDVPPPRATHIATVSNRTASEVGVQCVNGLLCFHPEDWSRSEAFTQICNPTTRQIITLPDDPSMRNESRVSTHFAYDPIRDQFKVVRVLKYGCSYELKIFTLGDTYNSWRRVTPVMRISLVAWFSQFKRERAVCVNGAIHWNYSAFIMVFNLGNEQFRVINTPHDYSYRDRMTPYLKFPDLVDLGGRLTLIGYRGSVLNLWILKDYETQEWIQKSITLPCGIGAPERAHFPLCRVPTTGEILLLPYFVARRVKGIYHNLEKMSSSTDHTLVMELPQPLWPDQRSGDLDIFYYQENFISLK